MPVESKLDLTALEANRNVAGRNYWRNRLADYIFMPWFENHYTASVRALDADYFEYSLKASEHIFQSLAGIAASPKARHLVLMATLGVWIYRCCGIEDIVIFTPPYKDNSFPGSRYQLVPVRMNNFPDIPFTRMLTDLKESVLQDFAHVNYPVESIINPEFLTGKGVTVAAMIMEEVQCLPSPGIVTPDIFFTFSAKDILTVKITCNASRFEVRYIEQLSKYYFKLLFSLINNREKIIACIDIFTDVDKAWLLKHQLPAKKTGFTTVRKDDPAPAAVQNLTPGRQVPRYQNRRMAIPSAEKREYYPVSFAQRRFIYSQQMFKVGTSYNATAIYEVAGDLHVSEIELVFHRLIQRQDVFRTSFFFLEGVLVQKIHETVPLDIYFRDLTQLNIPESERETLVRREIGQFIQPFDLAKPPLFKVGLIAVAHRKWILLFDIDHSINDGASQGIIIKEFLTLLNHARLDDIEVQYKDFSLWQNRYFETSGFLFKKQYWLNMFSTIPEPLQLPTDSPRTAQTGYAANEYSFVIGDDQTEKLVKLSAEKFVTVYILLLTAFKVLMHKLTRQTDICIGMPFAQRNNPQLESMMGILLNTLVLRTYPQGNKVFTSFLQEVRDISMKAYANSDYPFEMLLQDINYRRVEGRNPLFDILFNSQNVSNLGKLSKDQVYERSKQLQFLPYVLEGCSSPFDMSIFMEVKETEISFKIYYKTELFERSTIVYIMNEYCSLLEQIIYDQDMKLDEYTVFNAGSKRQQRIKIVNNKN